MFLNIEYKSYSLLVPSDFNEYLGRRLSEFDELLSFIEKSKYNKNFRWKIEIENIQFNLLVRSRDREIIIFSKWLFNELSLDSIGIRNTYIESFHETSLLNTPTDIYYNSIINELPLFNEPHFSELGPLTQKKADELKKSIEDYEIPLFERFSNFGLDLTAQYALIRIHLLKFLAVLPSLNHDKGPEVKRLFSETLRRLIDDSQEARELKKMDDERSLPFLYLLVIHILYFIVFFIPATVFAYCTRKLVGILAKRFIAGESIELAKSTLEDLKNTQRNYTIDQLGELVISKSEADLYMSKVLDIIKGIATDEVELNSAGVNVQHISIKISALSNDFKPYAFDYVYEQVSPRLIKVLSAAKDSNVFINIDAEHYHYRDIVFSIYKKVLLETEDLMDFAYTGIVVQAYLKDSYSHLLDVLSLAKSRGIAMPVRLVKGAYWDAETVECEAHNLESFQFLNKFETDLNFRQLIYITLQESKYLKLAVASHNILDHMFSESLKDLYFPESLIEHQCLHMTYEGLSTGLSRLGFATRNYIPVGDLLVGMAYLVRRIMENSSQVGVLTIMRSHKEKLIYNNIANEIEHHTYAYSRCLYKVRKTFKNIYPVRTYQAQKNQEIFKQLDIIKVNNIAYTDSIEMIEPDKQWSLDFNHRIISMLKLANLLLINRETLSALIMIEAHKTLDESLADVDEAIDFINFYTAEALKLKITENFDSLGVVSVIAPWNFPLAIPVGMSVAPLVMGNSVILKPSEKTSTIIEYFHKLTLEAGIPSSTFEVVYGEAKVGERIVSVDNIAGAVFTGSMRVGSLIYKNLKSKITSSYHPFAITEMGGKNAVIVTNNCELDETVSNLLYSSFAHAGQKCSASSRIIIDNKVKDAFLSRFVEATKDIKIGKSIDLSTYVNPLIGELEKKKTLENIDLCILEVQEFGGHVHLDRSRESNHPQIVGPAIFEISKEQALSEFTQAKNEFFAPIVHVIGYDELDEALEIFNSTYYALTGGIFSQSNDDCEYLMERMECGNIYVNRSNTGARVAIEPFGGFKLSGTGPKAGSKEYLYQFIKLKNKTVDDTHLFERFKNFSRTLDLKNNIFLNRQIPGQINYNKLNTPLGRGLFIIDQPLSLMQRIEIALASLAGNEIALYFSKKIYSMEEEFNSICKLADAQIARLNAFDPVHYSHFNFIVANNSQLSKHCSEFVSDSSYELKKLMNYSPETDDFQQIVNKYTLAKSFAVNIMRHGALMDTQEAIK